MNSQSRLGRAFHVGFRPLPELLALTVVFPSVVLTVNAGQQTAYRLDSASYSAAEGGTISGTVTRYPVATSCTFNCDWFPNQQASVCLYLSPSGTYPISASDLPANWQDAVECVTLPPNVITANFSIPFNQNTNLQYDRTATLSIGGGLVDHNAIQEAAINLLDDDNPIYATIYHGGNHYTGVEIIEGGLSGANTATLRILRGTGLVEGRTIYYSISRSTASGSDYGASPVLAGSVWIPQGSDQADFTITALPDSVPESTETLTLQLAGGVYKIDAGWSSATVTILDDTPTISVSALDPATTEGGAPIGFKLQRSTWYPGLSGARSVHLSIGGGAQNGVDYTPGLTSPVTIPAGEGAITNWITPVTDTLVEGAESVSATVNPGNDYVVGTESSATAYIQDDYPVVDLKATDSYAAEPSDTGTFTITRTGNTNKAITVQLNITGTAEPGVDYTPLPTAITLAAGVVKSSLTVTPLANHGAEAAETVVLGLKSDASYVPGLYTNAVVTITGEGTNPRDAFPKSERYVRGSGTNLDVYSVVVPLDGLKGTRRADVEFFGTYTTAYHYNATNGGDQAYVTNRIRFNTPIASFGSEWGTPLFLGQSYSLGMYAGVPAPYPLLIHAFRRSDGGLDGTVSLALPYRDDADDWSNFATNGFARTTNGYGLTTVLRAASDMTWGTSQGPGWVLTHTAADAATNYAYLIVAAGLHAGQYMALNASGAPAYGHLYELNFEARPGWRSVFIDQPHFQGEPVPPDLWNKTPEELFNFGTLVTNAVSVSPSACTSLDHSPELRRHPTLDQFVADLNHDPLALANYVQNEIELTDGIAYRDDGSVATESVNEGGVNRSALGVYLEGQGSPVEQCALLIYLLRQANYPATYVFPPEGGLKLLDRRLGALLRMRINDGQDEQGRLYTTNQLITVNYPWVAAYIDNQWVHLFPWIKDRLVEEGLDLADYLPEPYKGSQLWVRDYLLGKTNLLAFATLTDDTPGTIFPRWLDHALQQSAPGISIGDLGMRYVNRRQLYSRWSDFPRPTWVTNTSIAVESLAASGITTVFPTLTNIFDTVQVELYSVANPQKKIGTPELRMADLHNRKFFLTHTGLGGGAIQAVLMLGPFRPNATGQGNFSASDTTLTNKQVLTLTLDGTDDHLKLRLRHRRQRALAWETALDPDRGFLDLSASREVLAERPLRKGDVAAICFDAGRVTAAMLRVHAQELWNMEQMLSTNALAASQVSVDVYQGSLVYLMGMSYYERVARFDEELRRLFKVQDLSSFLPDGSEFPEDCIMVSIKEGA